MAKEPKAPARNTSPMMPHLTEVKVQVARVEERLVSMCEKQENIAKDISNISTKLDTHQQAVELYKADIDKYNTVYKNDKKWAMGIFGVLYGIVIAWIEYRSR
jgi:chromosome segregation ATPase